MVETLPCAQVEAPAVPVAFDHRVAQSAVGKGRSLVRAEIFDGVKPTPYVIERQFRPFKQLDRRAASFRHILHATDRDCLSASRRLFEIAEF